MAITLSAQTLSEQEIIRKMASVAQATKSIQANFTQTRYSKMLKEAQVSEGKMFCQQPDKLRWEYTSPRQSALILDGTDARLTKDGSGNGGRNRFAGEMARLIMNSVAPFLNNLTARKYGYGKKAGRPADADKNTKEAK